LTLLQTLDYPDFTVLVAKKMSKICSPPHAQERDLTHDGTLPEVAIPCVSEGRAIAVRLGLGLLGFAVLWCVFYSLFRAFPYLSIGSDVIHRTKTRMEMSGTIFPGKVTGLRLIIFGNSKVMAGFVPDLFDNLAATDGLDISSFNSGFPGDPTFVPQLDTLVQHRSIVPDILLLTEPWRSTRNGIDLLHPFPNDHDIVDRLFPFRYFVRDTFGFILKSREHGGLRNFYREARDNDAQMIVDHGYYFIADQSHYPHDRLPDDFHLDSDLPQTVTLRDADPASAELAQLNRIVRDHHIRCYFVPSYYRIGERAPAPEVDQPFANLLREYTSCKLLGPDYYLYPSRMFSDKTHLNREGAKVYTANLYALLAKPLEER
jgi:hypothetical protein